MARRHIAGRFRRSPHLVMYWRNRWFFVHNYATGRVATLPAGSAPVLQFFDDWRTAAEYAADTRVTSATAQKTIGQLVADGFLLSSTRRPSPKEEAMTRWDEWNPSAGFFHDATRDVRFLAAVEGGRLQREKARTVPPPPAVKRYPRARSYRLPLTKTDGEFPRALLARRTWRQFAKRPLPLASLAALLGFTGGVQKWAATGADPRQPLKTSPSGGARHPIELYVWVRNVERLPRGLYHYSGDRHTIERIGSSPGRMTVERYLPSQPWYDGAAAIVFFSAVYERYLWKYNYPRAYRATLVEAGHQCQTFCLAATWLGLAPFCTMAIADSTVELDLGLDGISEAVLYAAGVGMRPSGTQVRSMPAGSRAMRVWSNRRVFQSC
jgi:SagB-type dehydrogenase family enzyme